MLSIAKTIGSVYSLLSPQKPSMSSPQGMHLLDARVASFDAVKPKGKKRTSSTKAKKITFTWDFSSPSIDQVCIARRVGMKDCTDDCSSLKLASTILQPHIRRTTYHVFTATTLWMNGKKATTRSENISPRCRNVLGRLSQRSRRASRKRMTSTIRCQKSSCRDRKSVV